MIIGMAIYYSTMTIGMAIYSPQGSATLRPGLTCDALTGLSRKMF